MKLSFGKVNGKKNPFYISGATLAKDRFLKSWLSLCLGFKDLCVLHPASLNDDYKNLL